MKQPAVIFALNEKNYSVIDEFLSLRQDLVVLLFNSISTKELKNMILAHEAEYVLLDTLIEEADVASLNDEITRLVSQVSGLRGSKEWEQYCQTHKTTGSSVADVLDIVLGLEFTKQIYQIPPILEKALARYDIHLVVMNEDVTHAGRALCEFSKSNNIPSLLIAHGTLISKAYTVHKGLFADCAAVFSERGKEAYLDIGVEHERLLVTGNPAWDHYPRLVEERGRIKGLLFNKYHLQEDLPLIMFGATWGHFFSGLCDNNINEKTLGQFFTALCELKMKGVKFQAVVKDRVENTSNRFRDFLITYGLDPELVIYATEDTEAFVVSSDIVVSIDSNLSIEAMMAGVPSVNLLNDVGLTLGPSFEAGCGILEVEPDELGETVRQLLQDEKIRARCLERAKLSLPRYCAGMDGLSSTRVAQVALNMLRSSEQPRNQYVWQQYLDVPEIEASQYHEVPRVPLLDMMRRPPRVAMDIGCGAGATLRLIKERYPEARTIGIELSRSAGQRAAAIADQVLIGAFDDFELTDEGIALESIDTVILGDVLEHMYNPWSTMVKLRPYLTSDAQVIISIPNVRNLMLMEDLAKGYWRYENAGLLDITHVRFFTLKEFMRFLRETGYKAGEMLYALDPRLNEFFAQKRSEETIDLDLGRMVLKQVTPQELQELCSLQFYVVATPGESKEQDDYTGLSSFSSPIISDSALLDYHTWLANRRFNRIEAHQFDLHLASWAVVPQIQVFVNALGGEELHLQRTLKSLSQQYHFPDCITVIAGIKCPEGLETSPRFQWKNTHKSWHEASNELAEKVQDAEASTWIVTLNAGDELEPYATLLLAEGMQAHPQWRMVYVDEDSIGEDGKYRDPIFKPDLNVELLLSYPYLGDAVFFRLDAFRELGGFRALPGVERHDLALRLISRYGDASVGRRPYLLHHHERKAKNATIGEVLTNGMTAVKDYLASANIPAEVQYGLFPGSFKIDYVYEDTPAVSILIAVGNQLAEIQECLESLLSKKGSANCEILVLASGEISAEMQAYLQGLEDLQSDSMRIFASAEPAPLSALHNMLAQNARGEYLLFLHHDNVTLNEGWVDALVRLCRRPGAVAASPRTLSPDGTVHRGGVILGLGGFDRPAFEGLAISNSGYMNRAHLAQEFSALAPGCLLVETKAFFEAGGFDPTLRSEQVAAVDLCVRLRDLGHLLWTPHVSVMSRLTATTSEWPGTNAPAEEGQQVWEDSSDRAIAKSLPKLARDPAYSPNLSLSTLPAFTIEPRREFNWKVLEWKPLPRILTYYADHMGCGHYRILAPTRELERSGKAQVWSGGQFPIAVELAGLEVDSLIFQRPVQPYMLPHLKRCRTFGDSFIVFELDDLITNLPEKSVHFSSIPKSIGDDLRNALQPCHRFVVSTEYLKEEYKNLHDDIVVVPNYVEYPMWKDLKPLRNTSAKPRVGWAGGSAHKGDLELIEEVVRELADEVDWVFMGMCPDSIAPYVKEVIAGVPFLDYPAKMASMNLDLALAPLEYHPFNLGKSHLRLLEYGILGWPVICTDILPYQGAYPVTRLKNKKEDWIKAIREHINDRDEMDRRGAALKQYVIDNWLMEDHLDEWLKAWMRP